MSVLELAIDVAREAGALLRDRFRTRATTGVGTKSSTTDMVSDADRASESLIVKRLMQARPGDAILGEETGQRPGTTGARWVVDPLDGTTNFLFGIPHWAVSIAFEDVTGVLAGVVYDAMRDECFAAARGEGATCNERPIACNQTDDVQRALVTTGFSYQPDQRGAAAKMLPIVLPRVRDIRRAGAATLDLAWVACGRVDAYYEGPMQWWDVAAGSLLVTEAGGVFDTLPPMPDGVGYIAAGARLFQPLRSVVAEAFQARA
jgi:myo-inositol-1(or 4)-monophosphatase